MTNKMIDNRVKKLRALEAQKAELEAQADAIRSELKAELEANNETEHNTGNFIVRWKEIISQRVDTKALPAEIRAAYSRECRSWRFSIA